MSDTYPIILATSALTVIVLFIVIIINITINITNSLSLFSFAIFMLGLGFFFLYMDSFIPGISNISNPFLEIVFQLKNVFILTCILAFFIITIRTLLKLSKENTPQKTTNKHYFEGFQNYPVIKLIQKVQTLSESMESALDDLSAIESETCSFVSESRQTYLDANVSSGNENDVYNACLVREGEKGEELCKNTKPSPERQKELETRRMAQAQQKYQLEFSQFQTRSGKSTPLLECFLNEDNSDETELRDALQDLKPYLLESFQKSIRDRCEKVQMSMNYVQHLTQKGRNAIEKSKLPVTEGFTNSLLIQEAEESIHSVETLLNLIQTTKNIFENGKQKYEELNGKVNRAVSGTPQQSDLVNAISPTPAQGNCPRFMFSYGKDPTTGADGFCCPFEPTGYDTVSGQYQECGPSTKESEKNANRRRNAATQKCGEDDLCIRSMLLAFNKAKQQSNGCRSGENPLESTLPACSYVCKNGEPCQYSEFRLEK